MKSPLKSFVKKQNSNCDFCNNFHDYEWTYKLFKNIFNDFLNEGKGKVNMVQHNYSKKRYL